MVGYGVVVVPTTFLVRASTYLLARPQVRALVEEARRKNGTGLLDDVRHTVDELLAAEDAKGNPESAIGANEQLAALGASEHTDARAIAADDAKLPGDVGPGEILRGALLATKSNGQPDWPTRLSAVRALAALFPEEFKSKSEQQPTEPSIVVYDLPPGASPVLHRAAKEAEAPVSNADAPSAQHPTSSRYHMFNYDPPDGESVYIGMWSPPDRGQWPDEVGAEWVVHGTDKAETAERWRAELSAGRLPESSENVP